MAELATTVTPRLSKQGRVRFKAVNFELLKLFERINLVQLGGPVFAHIPHCFYSQTHTRREVPYPVLETITALPAVDHGP